MASVFEGLGKVTVEDVEVVPFFRVGYFMLDTSFLLTTLGLVPSFLLL